MSHSLSKAFLSFCLFFLIALSVPSVSGQSQEKIYIPKKIKKVMEEGLQSGRLQSKNDIPFEIVKVLYLPALENHFTIIFFEVKNNDLGFSVPAAAKGKRKEAVSTTTPPVLKAEFNLFLWFHEMDGDSPRPHKEQYVPTVLESDAATYNPEEKNIYTVTTILPGGRYRLAAAITSQDLKRIGTFYFSFNLPGPQAFQDQLGLSPVFFIKSIDELPSPEVPPVVHRNLFIYSAIKIEPKTEHVFLKGETPDIFYYIYGCQHEEQKSDQFDLERKTFD